MRSIRTNKRQRGFSMIELLVAVLIMGIGVLGISGLQLISLQNNRSALQRAEAVQLAYDILDRIRANQTQFAAYGGVDIGDAPPAANNCNANPCTAGQMVSFDLASWKCVLGAHNDDGVCAGLRGANVLANEDDQPGLPVGDGSIAINNQVITVTVQWTESGDQQRQIVISSEA